MTENLMSKMNKLIFITLYCTTIFELTAQTTLWKNHNPYGDSLIVGQLLRVNIKERFKFKINSKWQNENLLNMKLHPDRNNVADLKDSDQSRKSERSNSVVMNGNDQLNFSITGTIESKVNDQGVYSITAKRSINVDGKPIQLNLTGQFMASDINDNEIQSNKIANLQLTIISKPNLIRDDKLTLKPLDPNDKGKPKKVLTEKAQREFLLKHVQEIMGYFK